MSPIEAGGPSPEDMGLIPKESDSDKKDSVQEQLDTQWYDRFEQIGSFEAYEYLVGDKNYRDEEKRKFETGEIENPVLDYPKIDTQKLSTNESQLLELKNEIIDQEMNDTVKQTYRWKINEKIAEIRLLRAAATGDMKWFNRWSKFVFGSPSPEVFAYTIQSLQKTVAESLGSDNEQIRKAAEELQPLLPSTLSTVEAKELPSEETVKQVREVTLAEFRDLIEIPEIEGGVEAKEIQQIFEQALAKLKAEGWRVTLVEGKIGINVDQENKTVKIPHDRKVPFKKLQGLIAHELGTHVARRLNGERSKLKLLGLGLDRSEKAEEGVATMREKAIRGQVDEFLGLDGHLGISLAQGLDGTPRDFRQVYTFLEKFYQLRVLLKPDEGYKDARTEAWNRTVRTFRGTDCKTPGACFTKDIIYQEGNIAMWDLIKTNPNELMRLSIGTYDPANERHIWILGQLGITDTDLAKDPLQTKQT